MLTTVAGIYENGQITWEETPPTLSKTKVLVTFLENKEPLSKRIGGSLKGKVQLPVDFNEPLDDLKEYM